MKNHPVVAADVQQPGAAAGFAMDSMPGIAVVTTAASASIMSIGPGVCQQRVGRVPMHCHTDMAAVNARKLDGCTLF